MTSFCATATPGFHYHFYVAHDHWDPFFRHSGSHDVFTKAFYQKVGFSLESYMFLLLCIIVYNNNNNHLTAVCLGQPG